MSPFNILLGSEGNIASCEGVKKIVKSLEFFKKITKIRDENFDCLSFHSTVALTKDP